MKGMACVKVLSLCLASGDQRDLSREKRSWNEREPKETKKEEKTGLYIYFL